MRPRWRVGRASEAADAVADPLPGGVCQPPPLAPKRPPAWVRRRPQGTPEGSPLMETAPPQRTMRHRLGAQSSGVASDPPVGEGQRRVRTNRVFHPKLLDGCRSPPIPPSERWQSLLLGRGGCTIPPLQTSGSAESISSLNLTAERRHSPSLVAGVTCFSEGAFLLDWLVCPYAQTSRFKLERQ